MANFNVQKEVTNGEENHWQLCFQYGEYHYDDNTKETGYRFIWRKPDGSLQPARGQARIPSGNDLLELLSLATKEGWFITIENL